MNETDRSRTAAQFMRDVREDFGITKTQLKATIDALDDYLTANATAINQAIPAGPRAALSTAQKASIMGYVAFRRAGKLKAEEDGNG